MKPWVLGGIGVLVGVAVAAGPSRAQQPAPTATPAPAATAAAPEKAAPADKAEVPACADCHDQAKTFTSNPHGHPKGLSGNAICAPCHGDGTAHAQSGGDTSLIKVPRGDAGAPTCTTCHNASNARTSFLGGAHAQAAGVNCFSCHAIHSADTAAPKLLVKAGTPLCGTCHAPMDSVMKSKPFAHHLDRGGLTCVSCHDPHGRRGMANVRTTRTGELACLSCHAEKRGPFVFQHVGDVAGDCTSCHEPHGSSNPHQLKRAQVFQLCLECHSTLSTNTMGSQPPAFHNINLPRYRNCTTCHVAIHGSNRSPALLK